MEALVRELMEVRSIGIFIGGLLVTMIILSILINFCQVSTFVTKGLGVKTFPKSTRKGLNFELGLSKAVSQWCFVENVCV